MPNSVIVVGVDGSDGSRRALRWALAEAKLRGCAVEAVTAWPARDAVAARRPLDATETQRAAVAVQQSLVDEELARLQEPPMVSSQVVHGDPVEVLLSTSSRADLLVVGSHSTSTVLHVMLGSVSEACARMAECPVVVLPVGTPGGRQTDLLDVSPVTADDGGTA